MNSKFFKTDIPVTLIERKINGQLIMDYDVSSLRDIIHNSTGIFKGALPIVEIVPVSFSSPEHPSFLCTICDPAGRRIQAIGECDINSLFDDEYLCNAVGIAFERAFKNAAVRYLDIEEIPIPFTVKKESIFLYEPELDIPESPNPEEPVESPVPDTYVEEIPEQPATVKSTVVVEDIPDDELVLDKSSVISSEEIPEVNHEEIQEENVVVVEESEAPVDEKPAEEDFASVIITIGKYNGKNKTAKQIAEEDAGWVDWVIKNMKATNPDVAKQKEALAKCKG